jgi:hypothetical protein
MAAAVNIEALAPSVAALEDKIVQRAVATLLNAIYEEDFLGVSYGFETTHAMACYDIGVA